MNITNQVRPRDLERWAEEFDSSRLSVEETRQLANCIRRSYGIYLDGVKLFLVENRLEKSDGSEETNQ